MTSVKVLVVIAFITVFSAGAVVGTIGRKPGSGGNGGGASGGAIDRSHLAESLGLDAAQRDRVRAIWSDAIAKAGPPPFERIERIQREREDAIMALLGVEEAGKYKELVKRYSEKIEEVQREMDLPFRDAEERTKQVLTPAQREKYERFLRDHHRRSMIVPVNPGVPAGAVQD